MWVIFFHETPHFWLIGGETYRVGKKDCHVVIQDDRSISRTHLTITVGVASSGGAAADACSDQPSHILPQPITLTDSSTYGTAVIAAGEEGAGEEETQDSGSVPGASTMSNGGARPAVLDTGIVGLRYTSGAFARSRAESASGRSGSVKKSGPQPILPLPKGQPYTVPVERAAWSQFTIQLGHHGATLRLVWVDVPVLCEDVDVEMQTKLEHALRCCGARQELAVAAPPAPLSNAAATPHATPNNSGPLREPSRNTLSERSAPDVSVALAGAPPLPALLGGSSVLTLSQRTSVAGTPSLASTLHATEVAAAHVGGDAGACYNNVAFLVTSTIQPSTAVVGMLCRAVPVVTPAFFVAIRDRASPQVPLPDPRHFLPPPSAWWCDLIQHARLALSATPTAAAGDPNKDGSGPGSADTSATVSPSAASVQPPEPLAAYFAPDVRRCALFSGVTFVVVQRVLYDELLSYVECTGAAVVWEGGLEEWVTPESAAGQQPLAFSPQGFAALQAFFARHRCHVLLYDAAEEMPFASCLPVLQHSLGLCSVEYGALIESIVVVHPPSLSGYPDTARMPQTEAEVQACVRQARGEASSAHDSDTEDSEYDATTQAEEATEGRRTDAQPLFPDAIAPGAALPRKSSRVSGHDPLHGDGQLHKRPRREDAEGWVTLGRPVGGVATGAPPSSNTAAPQVSVRTAEIHFSPYALPSYPCFAELNRATTAGEAASAAVHSAEQCKSFVKQALPAAEPLVELEEHRARRQLASSMLVARVPTVDADSVVPEQVVMGGGAVNGRAADAASVAFNTFDTAVHNAASRRRGTTARRGRGGARANATTAPAATAGESRAMVDVDGAVEVDEAGSRDGAAGSSTFHIFDIDGIF